MHSSSIRVNIRIFAIRLVCDRWVYDPYFQHFTGKFFQHSSRTTLGPEPLAPRLGDNWSFCSLKACGWRMRLAATHQGPQAGHVTPRCSRRLISFLTVAKLLHAAISGLARLARKHGVKLRHSYQRIANGRDDAGRYAHAKQFKRHHRDCLLALTARPHHPRYRRKIEGTGVGGGIRRSAVVGKPDPLAATASARWKLYSFHAPEVECIGKGKARAPYEFASKPRSSPPMPAPPVSVRAARHAFRAIHMTDTRSRRYLRHGKAHRLRRRARLCRQGISGHNVANPRRMFISGRNTACSASSNELRRRSAIVAVIGT